MLLCDEPISAMDVSLAAQTLNLLDGIRRRIGLAMLFVTHDLAALPGLAIIAVPLVVGTALGLVAGNLGGTVDLVAMRLVELFLVLPSTLVALAVVAALGPGLVNTMIAITLFWWPRYARIVRDEVRRLRARPHVEAARIGGSRGAGLVLRHIAPGVAPALLVTATLDVANVVMTISLRSFLDLGQPAPAPELGAMTARSVDSLTAFCWLPARPSPAWYLRFSGCIGYISGSQAPSQYERMPWRPQPAAIRSRWCGRRDGSRREVQRVQGVRRAVVEDRTVERTVPALQRGSPHGMSRRGSRS